MREELFSCRRAILDCTVADNSGAKDSSPFRFEAMASALGGVAFTDKSCCSFVNDLMPFCCQ